MKTRVTIGAGAMLLAAAPCLSGCVMAVRHAAREVNRSDAQSRAQRDFPVGTDPDRIRTALSARGYVCSDLPAADAPPIIAPIMARSASVAA